MEVSRIRVLFLICLCATALPGCSWLGLGRGGDEAPEVIAPAQGEALDEAAAQEPIINPQVERREIRRKRIDTEDFELGAYAGIMSIEDFESSTVVGARLAYHRGFLP
jgi:hypothetical protein